MTRTRPSHLPPASLAASIFALVLAGCGGGGGSGGSGIGAGAGTGAGTGTVVTPPVADTAPKVTVDDLATGAYIVSTGNPDAPTVGKYYAGADGSRLLALADADDRTNQLYARAPGASWRAVPVPAADVKVALLLSGALPASTVEAASLAGSYATLVAASVPASFTLKADGTIVPGSSACKVSGKVSTSSLPGTLKLDLATTGCGSLPAAATGVLAVDADYAPARFRLIADDGSRTADLWAYGE